MTPTRDRELVARIAGRGARGAFFAVIVLSPFRGRLEVVTRHTPPIYTEFTDYLLSASDIALCCMLVCWLAQTALRRQRIALGPRFIAWPVVTLLVVATVGIPFSVDPSLSTYTTVRLLVVVALALYVINEVSGINELVLPISLMVVVQAVVGIGQVVGQRSLSLGRWGEHVLRPELGVSVVTTSDGTRVVRAYGLTDHPNILGGLLVFGVLVLVGAFAARSAADQSQPTSIARRLFEPFSLVVLAMAGACVFVTFSRGSWIGACVGLVVLIAMVMFGPERRAAGHVVAAAVAIGLGAAPFIAPYHDAVAARTDRSSDIATETRSIDEREELSTATRRIATDHPVLGVGVGTLPLAMREAEPDFRYDYQPAPTVLLDVTAETGFAGGFAYLVVLVAPWIVLIGNRRRWTAELAGASAALAAVTVVGFFDYYTWAYTPGRIWMWLVLGLWISAYRRAPIGGTVDV